MRNYNKQYINGEWVDSTGDGTLDVIDPTTEETIGTVARGTKEDVDKAVQSAKDVYLDFRHSSVEYRKDLLDKIVKEYENRKNDLIETITDELGSPLSVSENVHWQMGYDHFKTARDMLDTFEFRERRGNDLIIKEGIGVAGLITPWNFPTNQISLKLAGALAAGSPIVVKPTKETPYAAIILAEIFDKAGVPDGVFNLVNGKGSEVGDAISTHPDVRIISFTGSDATGTQMMQNASEDIKKVSLELGGKSPFIVLEDSDIDYAAESAVQNVILNTGQVCTAGTRTLVPESIKDKFVDKAIEKMRDINVGEPRDQKTQMGPLINKDQYDRVQSYIQTGTKEATLAFGGLGTPETMNRGYFVNPTIFTDVDNSMTIAQEEIFGPVMSIITYKDIDDAIDIANDTVYGLAGYVVGKDQETLQDVALRIEAGTISVNDGTDRTDLPFGGYKRSGIGREWGDYGIEEFLEVKAVSGFYNG